MEIKNNYVNKVEQKSMVSMNLLGIYDICKILPNEIRDRVGLRG